MRRRAIGSYVGEGGVDHRAPADIRDGIAIYPALAPIMKAFRRLSRGRDWNVMSGAPMPIKWRDMQDMLTRFPEDDRAWLEDVFEAMDEAAIEGAHEVIRYENKKT